MSHIVRRVQQTPAIGSAEGTIHVHRAGGMLVESNVIVDIQPGIKLSWCIEPPLWTAGFTLMVFRNTSGFHTDNFTTHLPMHGQLIIEADHDGVHEEHPAEGTYYYTFVLYRKMFLGLVERQQVLRFSETVPSAKVGIGRIKDKIELEELLQRHELGQINHATNVNEAEIRRIRSTDQLEKARNPPQIKDKRSVSENPLIADELSVIDAIVEAAIVKQKKLNELKDDPRFSALPPTVRKRVRQKIKRRLDSGEMSARHERRKRD